MTEPQDWFSVDDFKLTVSQGIRREHTFSLKPKYTPYSYHRKQKKGKSQGREKSRKTVKERDWNWIRGVGGSLSKDVMLACIWWAQKRGRRTA